MSGDKAQRLTDTGQHYGSLRLRCWGLFPGKGLGGATLPARGALFLLFAFFHKSKSPLQISFGKKKKPTNMGLSWEQSGMRNGGISIWIHISVAIWPHSFEDNWRFNPRKLHNDLQSVIECFWNSCNLSFIHWCFPSTINISESFMWKM